MISSNIVQVLHYVIFKKIKCQLHLSSQGDWNTQIQLMFKEPWKQKAPKAFKVNVHSQVVEGGKGPTRMGAPLLPPKKLA
jgi:hypothetical protein